MTAGGSRVRIVVEIDVAGLPGYTDSHLAALWHVTQVNPAPHGDREAGDLAEQVGREIIRRWLGVSEPELWRHQGRDYYWSQLRRLGKWNASGEFQPTTLPQDEDDTSGEVSR